MKPSVDLFRLIKSLSKSEKRFFKLNSALQAGEKNYLKLFDAILDQDEYDEQLIKEQLTGENFIQHLPSEKNHLFKLILKSLRLFYSDLTIQGVLIQDLKNIEILYNKSLYKECEKLLLRAKIIANDHEEFYFIHELINWQKRILEQVYDEREFSINLESMIEEEEENLLKLSNLSEYNILNSKVNAIFRSGGFIRNQQEISSIESIQNHPLVKGKNTALSIKATSICYYIKGLCAATNRSFQEAFDHFSKVKSILDKHPYVKEEAYARYLNTFLYIIKCHISNHELEKAQDLLRELEVTKVGKKNAPADTASKLIIYAVSYQLEIYHAKDDFAASVAFFESKQPEIDAALINVTKEQKVHLSFLKAYAYFGFGHYKKAQNVLNEILNEPVNSMRKDLFYFAQLLNLMLHYELNNYEYLEYLIKSTQRQFSKIEKDYTIDFVVLTAIKGLIKTTKAESKQSLFLALQTEVNSLLEIHAERIILEFIDINQWINAHIKA